MKRHSFVLVALLLYLTCVASATIRVASRDTDSPFQTIQAAINASSAGDTVIVRGDQGTWSEGDTVTARIVLIGFGNGCSSVPATYLSGGFRFRWGSAGSVVEGFRTTNGYTSNSSVYLDANVTGITVRRCRMEINDYSVRLASNASVTVEECILANGYWSAQLDVGGHATFRNCIFATNGIYCIGSYSVTVSIQNCAFLYSGSSRLLDGSANWSIDHCIFWSTTWNGSFSNSNVTASYNAITTSMVQFPGTNNIVLTTNPFVNYSGAYVYCTSDLHPTTASGLIDAGDPAAPHDRDGSRRDLGIYGGPQPYVDTGAPDFPLVINMFASPTVPQNGVLEIRTTGRVGRGQ